MGCKYCAWEKVVKNGAVKGKQTYLSKDCGHRFFEGSDFPRMKTKSKVISTAIDLFYEGLSVRKVQFQIEKLFDVRVSQVTVWEWIMKYSELVSAFVIKFSPQLSGEWKVDETAIERKAVQKWFWEIIDEETRFLVASHLSGDRTIGDVVQLFEKGLRMSKENPTTIYVDGLPSYQKGFNKVFYSKYKEERVELVRKAGMRARKNNNIVERMHGTLKYRTRVTRGLKEMETVDTLLKGWTVHYNFVRKHQTIGKTPAQASGITVQNERHQLIKDAVERETNDESIVRKALRAEISSLVKPVIEKVVFT